MLFSCLLRRQTTCAYTFAQNGDVECKNRHLLDAARTLLFHIQVPRHF